MLLVGYSRATSDDGGGCRRRCGRCCGHGTRSSDVSRSRRAVHDSRTGSVEYGSLGYESHDARIAGFESFPLRRCSPPNYRLPSHRRYRPVTYFRIIQDPSFFHSLFLFLFLFEFIWNSVEILPRFFPDSSQILPRFFPDSSQILTYFLLNWN